MKNNVKMLSKIGGLGLAGALVVGATTVNAETMDVTVQVQNALAINNIEPMDFGTVYAATANGSAVRGISIAPNGTVTENLTLAITGNANDAPPFLSLVDGAPGSGVVATDATFNIIMPAAVQADLVSGTNTWNGDAADVPRIEIAPDQAGFYLTDFVLNADSVIQTGGTGSPAVTAADSGLDGSFKIDPGFGAESVQFFVGATIWTDGEGTRDTYDGAPYTGSFTVTAEFN